MNEFLHNMQCCLDEITAKELRQKLLEPTYAVKATPSSPNCSQQDKQYACHF